MIPLLPLLLACGQHPKPAPDLPAFVLGQHPEALRALELPDSSRPGGRRTPQRIALEGPWEQVWRDGPIREHRARLPVDQVFLGESVTIAPLGMKLLTATGGELPYERNRKKLGPEATSWRIQGRDLFLRCPGEPPEGLVVRYPKAADWEDGLNLATADREPPAFALRSTGLVNDDREGLLLPSPGRASWELTVPRDGVLGFEAQILRPGVHAARSDGVELVVWVDDSGRQAEAGRIRVEPEAGWIAHRVDLSPWAGHTVQLALVSEPGDDPLLDYLFLAQPTVYTPKLEPRRVVLVFVDTLRRDHVGVYGYDRHPTTPALDAWSEGAVVFDAARAPAPWTLPSARALVSGQLPHRWGDAPNLPERLDEAGWATAFYTANPYLRPTFDMDRGWSSYRFQLKAKAQEQVDRALGFLEAWPDRDAAVLVQIMDPHLPYTEPKRYRSRWASERPEAFQGQLTRDDLVALDPSSEDLEAIRGWLLDRYDQNLRYVDDQVARLLGALDEDDVVVFFADHGEEFWEHGGVEHGHAMWEELLAVPLIIRAPGLAPGRVRAPVSLLDVTPTVLELLGLPSDDPAFAGRSLVAAAAGEPTALEALERRPLAFGQTLYGDEAWGVLRDGQKWWFHGPHQHLFDLGEDPSERRDLSDRPEHSDEPWVAGLSEALGVPVLPVWRLEGQGLRKATNQRAGSVEVSHPAGFAEAWSVAGIRKETSEPQLQAEGSVRLVGSRTLRIPRESYLRPSQPEAGLEGLALVVDSGEQVWEATRGAQPMTDEILLAAGEGEHSYSVTRGWAPRFEEAEQAELDPQTAEQLRELGYVD